MERGRCRTANIALQALVGKGRQVSRLVPKLGQSAANRGPLLPHTPCEELQNQQSAARGRWAGSRLVLTGEVVFGPFCPVCPFGRSGPAADASREGL